MSDLHAFPATGRPAAQERERLRAEALERYHRATTPLEQHQARTELDLMALDEDAWRKVRAAMLRGDPWMLERWQELGDELEKRGAT